MFVCAYCQGVSADRRLDWDSVAEHLREIARRFRKPVVVTGIKAAGTVTALRERGALGGSVPAIKCSAYCE